MKADPIWIRTLEISLKVAVKSLQAGDKVAQKVPVVSRVRALVLDTVLGPEEEFDRTPHTTS